MKKIVFSLIAVLIVNFAFAQAGLNNAVLFLEKGLIDKAKASIDEASSNEKAISKSKFWFYKGEIYARIALDPNLPFFNLDADPIPKAYEAYKKAMELEPQQKGYYKDAEKALSLLYTTAINHGATLYKDGKDLKVAVNDMQIAHKINPNDSIPLVYGSAIAYENKDYNTFAQMTEILLDNKSLPATTQLSNYINLAIVYRDELKDDAKSISTLDRGLKNFPKDKNLLILASESHQNKGSLEQAIKYLQQGAEAYPNDYFFHINLGAIYYNKASKTSQEMSKNTDELKKDPAKKKKMQEEVNSFLRSALPHLEQADILKPDDIDVIEYLFIAYDELGMKEKAEATDKRISKIRKGQ